MGAGSIHVRTIGGVVLVVCGMFAGEGVARATSVSGTIASDQTWTLAGSPYVMTGDVTVAAGVTLTVQAGVSVQAAGADALAAGASPSLVELNVNGTLSVNGTTDNPVSFTSVSAAGRDDWYGVVVAGGATIGNASFAHATYGVRASTSALTLTGSSFDSDTYGVYLSGGTMVLTGLVVTNSSYGVYATDASVMLTSSVLRGNGVGARSLAMMWVQSCTVDHNGDGLELIPSLGPASLQIANSLITNNTTVGVYSTARGGVLFDGVDLYGNTVDVNVPGGATGAASYCNPLYLSANDLHLTSNSPFLTAAPGGQPFGALPYQGDLTPGLYGVIRSDTTIPAAGSPHAIPGDLEVAPGVTLTLEPGATLGFANAADLMHCGDDLARSELRVHGTLDAIGTSVAPITLMPAGALTNGAWAGVHLLSDAAPLTLSHFELAGAVKAVQVDGSALALFDHGSVHDSATGLSASNMTLDSVVAHDTSAAVALTTGTVTNLLAYSNTHALEVTTGPVFVANATFSDDAMAVYALSGGVTVENSILAHGTAALYGSGTVQYCDVWDFSQPLTADGTNNLSLDPGFVASPGDWHLLPGSACIDAGTDTSAPNHDLDGTPRPLAGSDSGVARWDLGAFEYAGAPGVGGAGGAAGSSNGVGGSGGIAGASSGVGGNGGVGGSSNGVGGSGGIAGSSSGVGGNAGTGAVFNTGGTAGLGSGIGAGGTAVLGSGGTELTGDAGASEGGASGGTAEAGAAGEVATGGPVNAGGSAGDRSGGPTAGSSNAGVGDSTGGGSGSSGMGTNIGGTGHSDAGASTSGGIAGASGRKAAGGSAGASGGNTPRGADQGATADNAGCGCRVGSPRPSHHEFFWAVMALSLVWRRRDRSRDRRG